MKLSLYYPSMRYCSSSPPSQFVLVLLSTTLAHEDQTPRLTEESSSAQQHNHSTLHIVLVLTSLNPFTNASVCFVEPLLSRYSTIKSTYCFLFSSTTAMPLPPFISSYSLIYSHTPKNKNTAANRSPIYLPLQKTAPQLQRWGLAVQDHYLKHTSDCWRIPDL